MATSGRGANDLGTGRVVSCSVVSVEIAVDAAAVFMCVVDGLITMSANDELERGIGRRGDVDLGIFC